MISTKLPSFLIACLLSTTLATTCTAATFTAGVEDGFASPVDSTSPSIDFLATADLSVSDVSGFDEASANRPTLHTFTNLPANSGVGTLRFRVAGNPAVGAAGNLGDGILLVFSDAQADDLAQDLVWSRTFGPTGSNGSLFTNNDPGLLSTSNWTGQSDASITLDLTALPLVGGGTLNLLPLINQSGSLDILLGDDSLADFAELTLSVPEPASAMLVSCLFMTQLIYRKRST